MSDLYRLNCVFIAREPSFKVRLSTTKEKVNLTNPVHKSGSSDTIAQARPTFLSCFYLYAKGAILENDIWELSPGVQDDLIPDTMGQSRDFKLATSLLFKS